MLLHRCYLTSFSRAKAAHSAYSILKTRYLPSPTRKTIIITPISNHGTDSADSKDEKTRVKNQNEIKSFVASKFQIFHDEDSPVIMDIEEERRLKAHGNDLCYQNHTTRAEDEFHELDMKRGLNGVFEIGDLVQLLKEDKAQDVFVASLPTELKYVDFIVVVTGKSSRHMLAMAEFVRKSFKRKMHSTDIIPRIEGENSKDWIALDLGNIALHIFSKPARKMYDLDSLWGVGSKHDDLCNQPEDPLITLLEKHSVYLGDLLPNETHG